MSGEGACDPVRAETTLENLAMYADLKDIPGLLANRIQQGVAREVFSLMEMGAADAKDVDTALKYGPAFHYATTGQLEVADFGGLDIWCTVYQFGGDHPRQRCQC